MKLRCNKIPKCSNLRITGMNPFLHMSWDRDKLSYIRLLNKHRSVSLYMVFNGSIYQNLLQKYSKLHSVFDKYRKHATMSRKFFSKFCFYNNRSLMFIESVNKKFILFFRPKISTVQHTIYRFEIL